MDHPRAQEIVDKINKDKSENPNLEDTDFWNSLSEEEKLSWANWLLYGFGTDSYGY